MHRLASSRISHSLSVLLYRATATALCTLLMYTHIQTYDTHATRRAANFSSFAGYPVTCQFTMLTVPPNCRDIRVIGENDETVDSNIRSFGNSFRFSNFGEPNCICSKPTSHFNRIKNKNQNTFRTTRYLLRS